MLTIISMIIGFITSILPEIMKRLQDASDKQHELDILQLQMQRADSEASYKLEAAGVEAYKAIVTSAHSEQGNSLQRANMWVVDLSASVRPIVTYLLLIAFIGFKICLFIAALQPILPWQAGISYHEAVLSIWGENENAMFAGIMAYWFGSRQMLRSSSKIL